MGKAIQLDLFVHVKVHVSVGKPETALSNNLGKVVDVAHKAFGESILRLVCK